MIVFRSTIHANTGLAHLQYIPTTPHQHVVKSSSTHQPTSTTQSWIHQHTNTARRQSWHGVFVWWRLCWLGLRMTVLIWCTTIVLVCNHGHVVYELSLSPDVDESVIVQMEWQDQRVDQRHNTIHHVGTVHTNTWTHQHVHRRRQDQNQNMESSARDKTNTNCKDESSTPQIVLWVCGRVFLSETSRERVKESASKFHRDFQSKNVHKPTYNHNHAGGNSGFCEHLCVDCRQTVQQLIWLFATRGDLATALNLTTRNNNLDHTKTIITGQQPVVYDVSPAHHTNKLSPLTSLHDLRSFNNSLRLSKVIYKTFHWVLTV